MPDTAPTGIFNVSTGTGHTVKEIFDLVVDHLGVVLDRPVDEIDPGPDDVPAVVLDPSHTIARFGWTPRYDFRETIRRMLAWYDLHGVTAIYSHLQQPANAKSSAAGRAAMSDFSGRNILIVGGAGFVGSNLAKYILKQQPRRLTIVDNLLSADRVNVPDDPAVRFVARHDNRRRNSGESR